MPRRTLALRRPGCSSASGIALLLQAACSAPDVAAPRESPGEQAPETPLTRETLRSPALPSSPALPGAPLAAPPVVPPPAPGDAAEAGSGRAVTPDWRVSFDPLPPEIRDAVWGTGEDPRPDHFDGIEEEREGQHYMVSDEENPQAFAAPLDGLGGALVGVGTDQMYLYVGWQRPSLVFLADYDPYVKAMHAAHMGLFLHCEDRACFRALWTAEDRDEGETAIRDAWAGDRRMDADTVDEAVRRYRRMRDRMTERFALLDENLAEAGVVGYLSDDTQYRFVRELIAAGRVRPLTANLLVEGAFLEIAELCEELGVPVRALYVSNAETYWSFGPEYRAIIGALPFDSTSIVLRTYPSGSRNGDYTYAVQPAHLFRSWLAHPEVDRVWQLRTFDPDVALERIPLVVLDQPPPAE